MSMDSNLQQAVTAKLGWEPSIVAAHIGVTAENGVVTLSGHVNSFMQKHAAEDAARRMKGVRAVAEESKSGWHSTRSVAMTTLRLRRSIAWPGTCPCRGTPSRCRSRKAGSHSPER